MFKQKIEIEKWKVNLINFPLFIISYKNERLKMNIPDKVVNRLTLYHFILDDLREDEKYISSTKISNLLNMDNSQVRKDLKYLDNSGKCRVGYEVKSLKRKIEECLGFKQTKDAFIVGAGNLGSALAKYNSFKSILQLRIIDTRKGEYYASKSMDQINGRSGLFFRNDFAAVPEFRL